MKNKQLSDLVSERFLPDNQKKPFKRLQDWVSFHMNNLIASIAISMLVALPIIAISIGSNPNSIQGTGVISPSVTATATITPSPTTALQ